jgi:alpha-1,6-mannosyltransferase
MAALGVAAIVVTTFGIAAGAASRPSRYVPARSGGFPDWLSGPFHSLGLPLSGSRFQTLMLVMCAAYLVVVLCAREIPGWWLAAGIVIAHVLLVLGPPLLSQDVFGYLGFARLGALHGLDPYTSSAHDIPGDPVFPFVGWPNAQSPYGPLFTLGTYALVPLGLSASLWALKLIMAAASLGAIALVARAAQRLGHSPRTAAAFMGLNPVLLVLAVGGDHNDTLILLLVAMALLLGSGAVANRRWGTGALVAAVGVKASAGLVLPFLMLDPARARERLRLALSVALSLLVLVGVGLIGFGTHALGFLDAVRDQQQLIAVHSIPAETARLVGLGGLPDWWRRAWDAIFVVALVLALWRTARGADWRVAAGWATLALLLSTAWLLPWYAVWVLPLAAVAGDGRLRAATLLFCAYAVLIHLPLADPLLSPGRLSARRGTPHTPVAHVHRARSARSPRRQARRHRPTGRGTPAEFAGSAARDDRR